MTRGDGSMTSLAMAHQQERANEEAATMTITSKSTSSPLTLMTFSKTLIISATSSATNTTFTPRIKPTKRDTLTATSRPTRRPWIDTGGSSIRGASVADFLMTCLRTWKRCSLSTHTDLRADSRAQRSSTAGQWLSAEATWLPPSLTAPENNTNPFGTLLHFQLCECGI